MSRLTDELRESYPDALLADGFEDALLGFGQQFTHDVAIYDWHRCVEILENRDGLSYEEAVEYMDFNVTGAWVGEHTPIFLRDEI